MGKHQATNLLLVSEVQLTLARENICHNNFERRQALVDVGIKPLSDNLKKFLYKILAQNTSLSTKDHLEKERKDSPFAFTSLLKMQKQ